MAKPLACKYLEILLVTIFCAGCNNTMEKENTTITAPPVARQIPKKLEKHGVSRTDNYYWLNDRENPEVIQYLEAENKYTQSWFDGHKNLYEKVLQEAKDRVVKDDESVPVKHNGYWYFSRYSGDDEYAVYYRSTTNTTKPSEAEVLLDVNVLSKGKSFCEEGVLEVSPDNKLLAYTVDFVGRRRYEIRFRDIATGKDREDVVKNTSGNAVWASDNQTVFYTVEDDITLRSYKVMRHKLGTPVTQDVCVYEEKDETFGVDVDRSKSGNFIFIVSYASTSTEYRYISSSEPNGTFKIFEPRQRDHEYHVEEANHEFYIRTNHNAPNYKICKTVPGKTNKENWQAVFEYNSNEFTEDVEAFRNYLVVAFREKGLVKLKVQELKSKNTWTIDAPEDDYTMGIGDNEEYDTDVLRYYYGSLKTPTCEYDINLSTKQKELLKQQKINVPYNPADYTTARIYAKAGDGTEIPVSLVYKTALFKPGTNPCLVYAYGSYGVISDAYFSGSRLSLLDRGFVYALAHVRGGEEMGRQWYEEGRLLNKKNTFTDFIACSKYMVEQKMADPKKLFAQGGSAGGLLIGAVANMAPDLYKAVIADVPFVDVVTTMLDTSIPLTTGEFDEWGNPEEKAYFDYMLSYSPYDNVQAKNYPAMLVTTGLHDSQVQFWEPAKWVAKLRATKTDDHVLLLRTNMDAGHGGASGRYEGLKEIALAYTFLLANS